MQASTDDLDFMRAMQAMFGMDEEEVSDLIERLEAPDMTALTDALVNQDKTAAEQIVASANTDETVNPLFRGNLDDGQPKKKKVRRVEDDYQYKFGDDVQVTITDPETGKVRHVDGTVYLPDGPDDTVGVKIQGKSRMVKRSRLNKLEENVIGMTAMPELARMQQLAGLQPAGADVAPTEIAVSPESDTTADPCTAAQQAMAALDVVDSMLPNIRLADIKQIRQRIMTLQTQMNEGMTIARPRKA